MDNAIVKDSEIELKHIQAKLRRFVLFRIEDESGVSGVGYVAEGIKFSDGTCVVKWLTDTSSVGIYNSPADLLYIHGHGGRTQIKYLDDSE
jgi:hypothetical protein